MKVLIFLKYIGVFLIALILHIIFINLPARIYKTNIIEETQNNALVDDFNIKLNSNYWNIVERGHNYNNELQYYSPMNLYIRNSFLEIEARKEEFMGHQYTSGLIDTKNKFEFLYGKIIFKVKPAVGKGLVSAIWLLPADEWLRKNGFINSNNILIYPEGEYNSNTIKAMEQLNYISGRSTNDGYNPKMPDNLYDIKVKNVNSDVNPNKVITWIDYAIDNKLMVILLFHKLENNIDKTLMKYKKEDFYKIINYIDGRRNDLNILTYSDWIRTVMYN